MNDNFTAEQKREIGKAYYFSTDSDAEKKEYGFKLIFDAFMEREPEATFIIARMLLDGVIHIKSDDETEYALTLMSMAADNGCIQARAYLNRYCEDRYKKEYNALVTDAPDGVLVDFAGKPIKINRRGVFTPVDATLDYQCGKNVLTLSANLMFLYDCNDEIADKDKFESAVYRGLHAWEGEYEVFGGQKLYVKVDLTNNPNLFDNIYILPVTSEISSNILNISNIISSSEHKERLSDIMSSKRSFAISGFKWSVNSRKIIYIQSHNGKFDDYDEIMHVAKHEFGHTVGLGDLYSSEIDSLPGVVKGTYNELDCYSITDKYYNLVMCDHHGPISNNDIEMVILAFKENEMQLYQPSKKSDNASTALGNGN